MSTLIVIPARLQSTRLPEKPLADIGGKPMILHVWERAVAAGLGDVVVACCHQRTADTVTQAGGLAVLTDPNLASGTDRMHAVVKQIKFEGDYILNVQGDMPFIDPNTMSKCIDVLKRTDVDIGTLGCAITHDEHWSDPHVVKALTRPLEGSETVLEAYDFTRENPSDHRHAYYHLGLYAYRPAALEKFVSLDQSPREKERSLEQMRALDNGMRIGLNVVDTVPLSVDVEADLQKARALYDGNKKRA